MPSKTPSATSQNKKYLKHTSPSLLNYFLRILSRYLFTRDRYLPSTLHVIGCDLSNFMFIWQTISKFINSFANIIKQRMFPTIQIRIPEKGSHLKSRNIVYTTIETYVTELAPKNAYKLKAAGTIGSSKKVALTMDKNEQVIDTFEGKTMMWDYQASECSDRGQASKKSYNLTIAENARDVVDKYLEYIEKSAHDIMQKNRQRKLYTNMNGGSQNGYGQHWINVVFEHPASFDTLAMEEKKKEEIMNDLLTFSKKKEYYDKLGKAHKRGYLLYGPPGTGKSTMIASMANFLDYDIYDLELTAVKSNTDLRRLLINIKNKSILVIEDIDCSLDLGGDRKNDGKEDRKNNSNNSEITLSGLLNFIDGLWSASGEERIVIFTTNHVNKLDPALIRRGRMDMHIELSYCSYEGFKVLAKNYLGLDTHHPLFDKVKDLLDLVQITPADVAEQLMCKTIGSLASQCDERLEELIGWLENCIRNKKHLRKHKNRPECSSQPKPPLDIKSTKPTDKEADASSSGLKPIKRIKCTDPTDIEMGIVASSGTEPSFAVKCTGPTDKEMDEHSSGANPQLDIKGTDPFVASD